LVDARSSELVLILIHKLDYTLDVVTTHISPKLANEEDHHPTNTMVWRSKTKLDASKTALLAANEGAKVNLFLVLAKNFHRFQLKRLWDSIRKAEKIGKTFSRGNS
jgi:predicted lipoprotein